MHLQAKDRSGSDTSKPSCSTRRSYIFRIFFSYNCLLHISINYTENVTDLYAHAQTVDTRRSSPIFQAPGCEAISHTDTVYVALLQWLRPICLCIERLHVTSSPSRLRRKTENSRHFGAQRDRSFYGDLHEMSDILIMLLICVESDKIPLLHKLKHLN